MTFEYKEYTTPEIHFDERRHPGVKQELEEIAEALFLIPGDHKGDIVISYFKDRRITTEYLKTDKRVVEKILSGAINGYHTEALLSANRSNQGFLDEFEHYIHDHFK